MGRYPFCPSDKNSLVVFGLSSSQQVGFGCEKGYIKAVTKFGPTEQESCPTFESTWLILKNKHKYVACL